MSTPGLILIGMPAAGKTTVGRLLATRLGLDFVDTDRILEQRFDKPLRALLAEQGMEGFCRAEEQVLLQLESQGRVIATGGSAVYGEQGMRGLRRQGCLIPPLPAGGHRLASGRPAARGMIIDAGQSLAQLYRARLPLYRRHAHIEIACGKDSPATVTERVVLALADR